MFARTGGAAAWSLGPTEELLGFLGRPDRQFPTIHIGGTNGKGSVAAYVYRALQAEGLRAAIYTSPHLVDVRERMVVDDRPISRDAFVTWTHTLRPQIERVEASFFEATTAIAFADFAARHTDIAVVEVGLGGRLDATNVVDPLVAAVTHVALEHADYLGSSVTGIAREKAGIAKRGRPFVIGEPHGELAMEMETVARRAGAVPRRVPPEALYEEPLGMTGSHQRRNAAVALATLRALPAPWQPNAVSIRTGFARARLPARFERRGRWILDVAHNDDAFGTLVATLHAAPVARPLHALVAMLQDKNWGDALRKLITAVDRLVATDPPSVPPARRWRLDAVPDVVPTAVVEPDFDRALTVVQQGAGTVLVCGSFHTVGDAMARLPGFAPLG